MQSVIMRGHWTCCIFLLTDNCPKNIQEPGNAIGSYPKKSIFCFLSILHRQETRQET